MSLTEYGKKEQKWRPLPIIRQVLDEKELHDPKGRFKEIKTEYSHILGVIKIILDIPILIEENEEDIVKLAKSQDSNLTIKDLELVKGELERLHSLVKHALRDHCNFVDDKIHNIEELIIRIKHD